MKDVVITRYFVTITTYFLVITTCYLVIIHYSSSRQVIWSHMRCLDFLFPEPEAREIFYSDNVNETILPVWS